MSKKDKDPKMLHKVAGLLLERLFCCNSSNYVADEVATQEMPSPHNNNRSSSFFSEENSLLATTTGIDGEEEESTESCLDCWSRSTGDQTLRHASNPQEELRYISPLSGVFSQPSRQMARVNEGGFIFLDGSTSPPNRLQTPPPPRYQYQRRHPQSQLVTEILHCRQPQGQEPHDANHLQRNETATTASVSTASYASDQQDQEGTELSRKIQTFESDGFQSIPSAINLEDDNSNDDSHRKETKHKKRTATTGTSGQVIPSLSTLRAAKKRPKQAREKRDLEIRKIQNEFSLSLALDELGRKNEECYPC